MVRHAHAGERAEAATALEARDAPEGRAPTCAEGALAPAHVLHLHLVRHEDLPIAAEKYDPETRASTKRTRTNVLTQGVDGADNPNLPQTEAGQTSHERPLGRDGGVLLAGVE